MRDTVGHIQRIEWRNSLTQVLFSSPFDRSGLGLILLLQIDTDMAVDKEFRFCDMGVAQFWITPADLTAGRFNKAWATTEGG